MTSLDFTLFPPFTASEWQAQIAKELGDRPAASLRWQVEPGITLEPFYTTDTLTHPVALPTLPRQPARVVQYLAHPDAEAARLALASGAQALYLDSDENLPTDWPETHTFRPPSLDAAGPRASIDALTLREAGATRVETLAIAAAQLSGRLAHASPPAAVEIVASVGPEWVPEVAFLRALRLVAGSVLHAYGLDDTPVSVLAVTSRYHMTAYAPHTNLLRGTLAAAAAVVGGADALVVRPYDALIATTAMSLRLARQTHLLLRDEAHLSRTVDAAAGAFAIDELTSLFAHAGWDRFRQLRQTTNPSSFLHDDLLQARVSEQHQARLSAVLSGKERIVGVTLSPSVADTIPALPAAGTGAFAFQRAAASFEALRYTAANQPQPRVSLLPFGDAAPRNARAGFARDFLAIAGIWVEEAQATHELSSGTECVILCAGDTAFAQEGIGHINALRERLPAVSIWVAGRPENAAALQKAGAAFFLHARAPLYDHLRDALAALRLSI